MSELFPLCLCRAGFESDLAAELQEDITAAGARGLTVQAGKALLRLTGKQADVGPYWQRWQSQQHWRRFPVFAREVACGFAQLRELPRHGRVERIVAAVRSRGVSFGQIAVYAPDHPDSRPLEPLARALEGHLRRELPVEAGQADALHVILVDSAEIWLALAPAALRAPWPAGVPRLKFPREAPSRSVLKLEEAALALLSDAERRKSLVKGMRAVDLGAAPGGWTWQLVHWGLRVTAIDNGPMDPGLMASGQVEHKRVDGFKYIPPRPVDWLVCDMVEKPLRVAELAARWLAQGWARRAVVNLKLPMKKRLEPLARCLAQFKGMEVRCKQLYHDREEVTALIVA